MVHITLTPSTLRPESRQSSTARRPATLRGEAEALLRDVAYVCKLTERVRTAILTERTAISEPR